MNFINTINALVEILRKVPPAEYAKIMKRIKLKESNLQSYAQWTQQGYTRNCLDRTPTYELILLCWDVGAKTPIHGHGGEDCWVYQAKGTVEEVRFKEEAGKLTEVNRMVLTPGKLTYMHDRMGYHALYNRSNTRAMTLHIYASPIDACKVYNNSKDCFEIKEMSYHTFKESNSRSLCL